jgi:hypothetical protein
VSDRYVTGAALARELGVSRQYVAKLVRNGSIVRQPDKRIDREHPTNRETISEIKERRDMGAGNAGGHGETPPAASAPLPGVSGDFLPLAEAKRRKEVALARQAELAYEERIGNLADISIVLAIIEAHKHGLVANFVDSIQRQAMQICSMVGAEGKERIVEDYLEKENKRRLEEADRTAAAVAGRLKRGTGIKKSGNAGEGED